MGRLLAALAMAGAGTLVAMQAPINSRLGKELGTFQAATVSFATGLVLLAAIALTFGGGLGSLGRVGDVPGRYLLGGVFGAVYVATVLVAVRTLGATGVTVATIAGQLAMAAVIDQYGLLGVARHQIGLSRIVGMALVTAGVVLVVRD